MDLIPIKKQKSISSSHGSDSGKNEGIKPHFGSDSVYPWKLYLHRENGTFSLIIHEIEKIEKTSIFLLKIIFF